MELNRVDYALLKVLLKNDSVSFFKGMTIYEILDVLGGSRVKWFNTQKGYGFIVGDDGTDYFVHYSNIKVSEFRHLDAGDHVEFDVETNDKGIQARHLLMDMILKIRMQRLSLLRNIRM